MEYVAKLCIMHALRHKLLAAQTHYKGNVTKDCTQFLKVTQGCVVWKHSLCIHNSLCILHKYDTLKYRV